ncbi:MAG: hypothetical protein LBK59_04960 [Bifidobacteriaceae bacterium]|jgi:hypothetical protein|nr:hypothetical protein [Bifidobacteriaceae bacterium]
MVTVASRPPCRPYRRITVAVVAVVGAGIVGGCTYGDDGVTSLASKAPGAADSPVYSDQRASAEALHACLTDADLPATLSTLGTSGDQASIAWEDGHSVIWRVPDAGAGYPWTATSGEVRAEVQEAFEAAATDYGLTVDGVDHSGDFERCWVESGYTQPEADADPAEELTQKQAQAEATNEWVACARNHGYPDLADVTAVADGWMTQPVAVLPWDITARALRTLLEACPSFDIEEATDAFDPDTPSLPGDFVPPMIQVPMPGQRPDGGTDEVPDDAAVENYTRLNDIIIEDQTAFWDELTNAK